MKWSQIFRDIKRVSIFTRKVYLHFISALNFRKFPPKKKIHFFVNLGVGLFIAFFCHVIQTTNLGESIINSIGDLYTRREAKEAIENPEILDKSKIVFIDIDHKTYLDWGEPDITPRDKLGEIVKKSYDGGAKVILLDFFLEKGDRIAGNDEKLKKVLKDICEKEKSKRDGFEGDREQEKAFAGIIFCRRIGFKKDLKENIFYNFVQKEKMNDQSNNLFYQAVPLISANIYDNVIRYWNSYEIYEVKEEHDIIWGVPFIAYMLYKNKARWMGYFKEKILAKKQEDSDQQVEKFVFEDSDYILSYYATHPYFQRIRFQIIPGKENENTGNQKKKCSEDKENNKENQDQNRPEDEGNVYLIRAKYDKNFKYIGGAFFKNKIVIIGNSSPDSGDIYRTPVGDMPGMYVLGNAINTILNIKQVKRPPPWLEYLVELVVIISAAYLFLYLTSFLALLIAVIVTLFGMMEFGYRHFMETGELLNSSFVIIGMVFHKITADIEDTLRKKGKLKHSE